MKLTFIFLFLLIANGLHAAPMDGAELKPPLPQNIWIELNKRISPGVVGIYVEFKKVGRRNRKRYRDPMFDLLEEFFGHGLDIPTPENIEDNKPIGTGFVVRKDGLIVTNYHVVETTVRSTGSYNLKVQLSGEKKLLPAEVIGRDVRGDIALLKVKGAKNLSVLELGDSDKLQVGEYVSAIGNPFGHTNSMTTGIISAIGREIKELNRFPFLQTDASINPGNSGGPLVNTQGYVVGVNTAIDARAQGIGFAIPSNYIKKIIPLLEKGGSILRGFLGIGLRTLTRRSALNMGLNKPGILISDVAPNTPAAEAGLQVYDVIIGFNGKPITRSEQLVSLVQDTGVGEKVHLQILRGEKTSLREMKITVTVGSYPEPGSKIKKQKKAYQGHKAPFDLGFKVVDSSSGARRSFNIPVESAFGPIVSEVEPGLPAAKAGLEVGDIIQEVNKQGVNRSKDVLTQLKKGSNILKILRGNKAQVIFVESD